MWLCSLQLKLTRQSRFNLHSSIAWINHPPLSGLQWGGQVLGLALQIWTQISAGSCKVYRDNCNHIRGASTPTSQGAHIKTHQKGHSNVTVDSWRWNRWACSAHSPWWAIEVMETGQSEAVLSAAPIKLPPGSWRSFTTLVIMERRGYHPVTDLTCLLPHYRNQEERVTYYSVFKFKNKQAHLHSWCGISL